MTPVVAVCLLNARGDWLLNLPALRAIAARYPGRMVLIVRRDAFATCLRDVEALAVIEVDAALRGMGYDFDARAVAAAVLEHGPVDILLSLNPWWSRALDALVTALDAGETIGFGDGPWSIRRPLDFGCHSSLLACRALDPGASREDIARFAWPPAYPPHAARFARMLREDVTPGRLIVVHRDTKPAKRWCDDRWAALLRRIVARRPDAVIVDVGQAPLPPHAADLAGHVVHDLHLPLAEAMALAGSADLFIGIDSCFLHAADIARVPLVALFFATDPHEFGAYWAPHRHLTAPTADALPVDAVFDAVVSLEAETGARRVAPAPGPALADTPIVAPTTIGLGTARWSFSCDLAAVPILETAAASGCTLIDLAGNHGGGDACAVVGAALARLRATGTVRREDLFLCSKAGFTEHLSGSALAQARGWATGHCLDRDYLAWEFDRQVAALGVDRLEAFMLQNPEDMLLVANRAALMTAIRQGFALFETLRAAGRLGIYGISTAEALRVPRGHGLHIDLADLCAIAEQVGGPRHGFRIIELPVNLSCLEGLSVAAHGTAGQDLSALDWAARHDMTVLASTAINGGADLAGMSGAVAGLTHLRDPAAIQLQLVRSLPGVTCALVGISTPQHLTALTELAGAGSHVW